MAGAAALSRNRAPNHSNSPSRAGKRRRHDEIDDGDNDHATTVPASSSTPEVVDLTSDNSQSTRKQRRVGPSTSTIPRTLTMQPHEELLSELRGKYNIFTGSVISSTKINKRVTSVLSNLGHIDLFSSEPGKPGVMMLHARAGASSKMITVMELAKRRMSETGITWYQYNRVYKVVGQEVDTKGKGGSGSGHRRGGFGGNQTVIEDTMMEMEEGDGDEDGEEDEEHAFESMQTAAIDLAISDNPATESEATCMSMFLSRVQIPELQSKMCITLQTNAGVVGNAKKA